MKKIFLIIGLVILVGLISFIIIRGSSEDSWLCVKGEWQKHGNPSATPPTTGCSYLGIASDSGNIIVTEPKANAVVGSPFVVRGRARVFENQFNFNLKNSQGVSLFSGSSTAQAPDIGQFGDFNFNIEFISQNGGAGTLEVFDYSAKDGSEIDKVIIPVQFIEQAMTLKVYFTNNKLDPSISCNQVFPVERTLARRVDVGRAAIEELLKGPTTEEKTNNYGTTLNPNVIINSLSIENKVAKIDFNQELEKNVAGSCRASLIRAQIEQTLRQFPTVEKVVISINGKTEDILQP